MTFRLFSSQSPSPITLSFPVFLPFTPISASLLEPQSDRSTGPLRLDVSLAATSTLVRQSHRIILPSFPRPTTLETVPSRPMQEYLPTIPSTLSALSDSLILRRSKGRRVNRRSIASRGKLFQLQLTETIRKMEGRRCRDQFGKKSFTNKDNA